MPKAYIAAPYTSKSFGSKKNSWGEIKDVSYINFLESIESVIKGAGFFTFMPHRDLHLWGKRNLDPETVEQESLKELSSSDLLVAYPEDSKGVNIELGWASVLKKNIIILLNENEKISIMHSGLSGITKTEIIRFRCITDLRDKLRECLNNFK